MFHKNLDNLIRERKVGKTDLCRHLRIARSTFDGYLNGRTSMPADKIQITAKYFGVTAGSLFGESGENDKSIRKMLEEQQKQINKLTKKVDTIAKSLQMKFE